MSREGKESREQTGGRLPYRLLVRWVALIGAAFMLSFTGCGGSGWSGDHPDKNNYALTITPSSPVVTVGNTIHLTASSPWGSGAQWSVLPASAGSIDQNGNFTASTSPGTATIMAMWSEDVRYTATAAATVVAAPAASISVSAPPPGNTSETASVPLQPGSTYAWAIQGGSISAGQGTPQIQFIAGRVGPTQISCNVTDAAGDSAVSTFIVPPNIEYRPSTYTFIRGADIGSVIPANAGGAALSWQVTPNLPPGLLFDSNTGVITGTPGVPAPAATFTVTATNAGGASNPFALTITTIDSAPIFSYIPNTYVLTLNAAITAISPTLTHGTVTAWKISPALPAGLGLDSTTGRILGTPSVLAPNLTYTVTASNNWGSSTTEPISIAVVDVPPAISYSPSDHTFTRGSAVTPVLPTNTGGAATSWAILPALPGGLVFDTSSGSVSGTPSVIDPAVSYVVTATNTGGTSAPANIRISVLDIVPEIQYPSGNLYITVNAPMAPFLPTNSGGPATSWNIQPAPPSGLVFDSATGAISGVPVIASAVAPYTITASNSGGTSKIFTLHLGAFLQPTAAISASSSNPAYGATVNLTPTFTNAASAQVGTTQGGSDISSAPVSGVPIATAAITSVKTYWLRATNAAGDFVDSSVTVTPQSVTVNAITPANPTRTVNSLTGFTTSAAGGATNGITWSASAGTMNASTGSWTAPGTPGNVTITATSTDDSSKTATTAVNVVAAVTSSIGASSTNPPYGGTVNLTPTFANAATAQVGTTPGGRDISSAPVSGVPIATAAITSVKTYWLRATNAAGDFVDSSVTVTPQSVTVNAIAPANPTRTVNSMTGFTTTAAGGATNGITWSASAGTMNASTGSWTAPGTAGAVSITASSQDDETKTATTNVNVVNTATASISASSANPPYGATVNLTPTFTNAASAQVGTTQGGSDISSAPVSGVPIATAAITSVKTYWLRATNAAGDFVDSSVTVTPQSVTVNAITPANPTRTVNGSATFTTTATGGATNGITWSASTGTMNAGTGSWTAPNAPGNVTITANSTDDSSKTASTVVNVVAAVTSSMSASTTTPLYGATVNLVPTFANATLAEVGTTQGGNDISSSPVTGVQIATAAITSVKTYWLRATNAAGDFVDSSVTVTPQTVVINPVTPAGPTRTVNGSATFTTTATGGATNGITWSASAGTMNAGTGSWTAPGTPGSVTITATSNDDSSKTAATTVNVVAAATASISASTTNPLYGATVNLTPTFANAASAKVGTTQGGSDISSSPTSGMAISTAAITSSKTYWLRATNAAGDFVDSSVTVAPQTVVVNAISPASPTRTVSSRTAFSTTATGGVTNNVSWSASAGTMNAGTGSWTAPNAPGNITITATSTDDSSKTATTTVNVVAAATASISASTINPLYGATVNLTPTFANAASAQVGTTQGGSDISSAPVSGVPIATAAITSVKTYWLRATNAAGDFADSSVVVTPQTVVVNAITPASPTRTVSSTTAFSTTATGGVTNNVSWSANAGTMNAGTGSWTAPGTPGSVTITATSNDDSSKTATTTVNVVAAATASISASTTNPLYGATVNLTPTFANAASAKVGTTQGGSDISSAPTSGSALATAAITSARTYWLRATNAAGDYVDSSVTVTPQTVVVNAISPANSTVNVNSTPTFTTTAVGGVTNGITWSANGGTMNAGSGVWTAPAGSGTFTITATSKDDGSKSATTTVTVVLLPTDSISASSTNPLYGATVNLTPTFANAASAKVGTTQGGSDISSSPTSGVQIATTAITSATTFWLRATNAAGSYVDSSVAVTPQTPIISAITKSASNVSVGYTATANATVSNAFDTSVDWTAACGSLSASNTASGANTTWTAPASPTSCVLTAKSHAYTTATSTATLTVVALPVATSLNVNNANPPYKGTVILTPLFSSGTGNVDHGVGVVTNNVGKTSGAITAATTFTLTVTNAAGQLTTVQSTLVTPQTVVLNPISPASPTITVSKTATFSATVTGGAANTIDWTATCGSFSPTNTASGANTTWTAPAAPQTCTLTAKSHDDTTKTTTTTATVVAMPTASITASTTTPQYGASVNLTPTFTGAVTASVGTTQGGNDISSAPTSGSAIATAAITSSSKYWLRATNAGGTFVDSSVTVNPQTVTIAATTAASTVSVGYTTTAQATVSNAVDTAVNWTATCGSFSPTNTASGANTTWTAPAAPQTCTLTASSDAESSITSSKAITVIVLPVASSLTPSTSSPIYGATISLTPVFSNGTGAVDQGVGAVTSGVGKSSSALTSPTTFTLTVTNAAGQAATASSGVVSPQTVAVTLPSPAGSYVSVGGTQSFSASAQNAVNAAVTWSSGGAGSWSGTAWTAPSTPGAYTITATSAADPTKSNSTTVNVVALPVIQSFSSAEPQVSLNHATTLTAVFTNGGGNAFIGTSGAGSSDISNSVATNTATSTGNLSAATTFTLTVYNLAGSSTAATLTVPVVVGSSTPTNPLSGAMYDHTSTLLPSGTVLIIGGQNGTSALNAAQLYDPVASSVSDAGTMNSARYNHTATLLPNNSVLVAGGDNGSTIAASEIWNGSFTATGSLNTPLFCRTEWC